MLASLYTHHGTRAYVDVAAGCLRHGPPDNVPHNLLLAIIDNAVMLVHIAPGGQRRVLAIRPEGPFRDTATQDGVDPSGRARLFAPLAEGKEFGLRAAGLLLCAESSGVLTLSRQVIGAWEKFRAIAMRADGGNA